jgi:hypothetical protein
MIVKTILLFITIFLTLIYIHRIHNPNEYNRVIYSHSLLLSIVYIINIIVFTNILK